MKNIQVTELTAYVKSALLGVAVGDALGVPVEFTTRDQCKLLPVKEMKGNGTHYQVKGTWSDDSSLTFCLAEGLCNLPLTCIKLQIISSAGEEKTTGLRGGRF